MVVTGAEVTTPVASTQHVDLEDPASANTRCFWPSTSLGKRFTGSCGLLMEMDRSHPSNHVVSNRIVWDSWADEYVAAGRRAWSDDQPQWGIYGIPEAEVGLIDLFDGGDVIELGCGTAYVSAWLARRGGQQVGIDN